MKKEVKQLLAMKSIAEQKNTEMLWGFDESVSLIDTTNQTMILTLRQTQELVKLRALQERQGYVLDAQLAESEKTLKDAGEKQIENFKLNQLIKEPTLNMSLHVTSQNMERLQNENGHGSMMQGSSQLLDVKDLYFDGENLLIDSKNKIMSSINFEKELKEIKHGVEKSELNIQQNKEDQKIKDEKEVEMVYRKASAISEIYAMVCSGQMDIGEAMIQVAAIGNIQNNVKQSRTLEMTGQMQERTEEERSINEERPNEYNSEEITFEEFLDLAKVCDEPYIAEHYIQLDEIVQQEIVDREITEIQEIEEQEIVQTQ